MAAYSVLVKVALSAGWMALLPVARKVEMWAGLMVVYLVLNSAEKLVDYLGYLMAGHLVVQMVVW